jgi:hypothetical protein
VYMYRSSHESYKWDLVVVDIAGGSGNL